MGTTKDASSESNWPWPEALDARVAAPDHHKPLFENERVRVLESWAEPGETIPVHTHCWAGPIYILSWSDFIRRDPDGNVLLDSRESGIEQPPGSVMWGQPLTPHSLENVGTGRLGVITFELKD